MSQARRKSQDTLGTFLLHHASRLIQRALFACLFLCALAMAIALATYSAQDPAWAYVSDISVVNNWLGSYGALFADISLYFLGLAAWGIPLVLLMLSYLLVLCSKWRELDAELVLLRSSGGVLVLACVAGLLDLQTQSGGVLGQWVGTGFGLKSLSWMHLVSSHYTAWAASNVLLIILGGAGLVLALGMTPLEWMDSLGSLILGLLTFVYRLVTGQRKQTEILKPIVTSSSLASVEHLMAREPVIEEDKVDAILTDLTNHELLAPSPLSQYTEPNSLLGERLFTTPPTPLSTAILPADELLFSAESNSLLPDATPMQSAETEKKRWFWQRDHVYKSAPVPSVRAEPMLHEPLPTIEQTNAPLEMLDTVSDVALGWTQTEDFVEPLSQTEDEAFTPVLSFGQFTASMSREEEDVQPLAFGKIASPVSITRSELIQPMSDVSAMLTDDSTLEQSTELPMRFGQATASPFAFTLLSEANDKTDFASVSSAAPSSLSADITGFEVSARGGPPTPSRQRSYYPMAGQLPQSELLRDPPYTKSAYEPGELDGMAELVVIQLKHFGIEVTVAAVEPGPVITRFELDLAPGVKVAQINNLAKDLARGLSVSSVRVVEVIPGKPYVGLEIPNLRREIVYFKTGLESAEYRASDHPLTLILGKDIAGAPVIANLAKMPHLLVAGTTGSGKSVGVNTMLLSLLFKAQADQLRLILIDPKMLELSVYEGIPHLLSPVVTDMKEAANALRWCVGEMERRYKLMSQLKVRNIAGFNKMVTDAQAAGQPIVDPLWQRDQHVSDVQSPPLLEPLPFIVVVIDEFADMMMIVGKKVEELIARLAQKARAAGIHLILATQRPSVDVITGLIKANIPTRIAFQVSSKIDSRTILDQMGAETLLGHGDMLYLPPGTGIPQRVHGAFVEDAEVNRIVEFLKLTGAPDYIADILEEPSEPIPGLSPEIAGGIPSPENDPLYDQAVALVLESQRASISFVQRKLRIGYQRAARLIEEMEAAGILGAPQSGGNREILVGQRDQR